MHCSNLRFVFRIVVFNRTSNGGGIYKITCNRDDMYLQGHRKVSKSGGEGVSCNVVGIIYPPVEIGLTDLSKVRGS